MKWGAFKSSPESGRAAAVDSWGAARERMVELLKARGITDPEVLRSMAVVPRHEFMTGAAPSPEEAYGDYPFPIEQGQTISQPYIVAYMTQSLELRPGLRVLEIGAGSGYQAAILACMGCVVFGIERLSGLLENARSVLSRLGYEGVRLVHRDGYGGLPEEAPYERIMASCAPPDVPESLLRQLADGGRLIAPVGIDRQKLVILDRRGDRFLRREDLSVRFVPMVRESK